MAKAATKSVTDPRIEALYRDCQDLARYISRARTEIARLRPHELKAEKLPHAGKELDTIVKETESATNEIMAAAEEIMSADAADPNAYKNLVDNNCLRIFEACSFQDITGQRIRKVVKTLGYIEERLEGLMKIMGPDVADAPDALGEPIGDARLLHGPQLHGEGVRQDEVDALLADPGMSFDPPPPPPPPPVKEAVKEVAKEPAKEAKKEPPAKAPAPKPEAKPAEAKPEPKAAPPKAAEPKAAEPKADPKKENSQADIDALFDDAPKPEDSAKLDQNAIDALFD